MNNKILISLCIVFVGAHSVTMASQQLQLATKQQEQEFLKAAKSGDEEAVRVLLAARVDVNTSRDDRVTALMKSAQKGHVPIVRILLQSKADVDATDEDHWTALMYATGSTVIRILLDGRANINIRGCWGYYEGTALAIAVHAALKDENNQGHTDALGVLLEHAVRNPITRKKSLKGEVSCIDKREFDDYNRKNHDQVNMIWAMESFIERIQNPEHRTVVECVVPLPKVCSQLVGQYVSITEETPQQKLETISAVYFKSPLARGSRIAGRSMLKEMPREQ